MDGSDYYDLGHMTSTVAVFRTEFDHNFGQPKISAFGRPRPRRYAGMASVSFWVCGARDGAAPGRWRQPIQRNRVSL